MNRLINMIVRQLINKGINAGIDMASGPEDGRKPTEEQKAAMKRTKQSVRMMRRLTRF
ncbi:MAG: hypothetical protein PVI41_01365 [Roseobacter sp.]|jgi:hypothetical protein